MQPERNRAKELLWWKIQWKDIHVELEDQKVLSIIFCVLHTNVSYHWQYGERFQKTFILNYLLDQVPLELNRFLDLESLSHQNFVLVKNLLKSQEFHWILSTDACIAFAQQVVFEMGAYLRVDGSYWNSCKLIPW